MSEGIAYIKCHQCGKLIEAERTHNGVCACWLGHCCGFGQDATIGDEIYLKPTSNQINTGDMK